MVSMKDLAAACNVSIATVSKALNDQHDVSAKTKEMVRKRQRSLDIFQIPQRRRSRQIVPIISESFS